MAQVSGKEETAPIPDDLETSTPVNFGILEDQEGDATGWLQVTPLSQTP